jgi:ribonuclease P protein component
MAELPRLKRRREFLAVAGSGRKAVQPGLILQAGRRPEAVAPEAGFRVGFTASRKVGNAVARNRARRRLRAASEAVLRAHAAPGHDYVLVARQATLRRRYAELLGDLTEALKRLKLYRQQDRP